MQKIFGSTAELQPVVELFEERMERLDVDHKEFLLVSYVAGKPISSLNEIVGIVGMPLGQNKGFSAILFYFTELDLPDDIKSMIDVVFNELFYSA